jgi:hypothetical protein
MIRISCSKLEQARINPGAYAQILAIKGKQGGGTRGMFAHWQDVAKQINVGELTLNDGLKELQQRFLIFDAVPRNLQKQDFLSHGLTLYCKLYDKLKFGFVFSKKQVKWAFTNQGLLTGYTPWAVKDNKGFIAYFPMENISEWRSELKYPLLQQYLAEHRLQCEPSKVQVGVYCLKTNEFDLKSYSKLELSKAIVETKELFQAVEKEYSKIQPMSKSK